MAKTFQESYIDVERAYSQGQFQQALSQADNLLTNRPEDADDLQYSRLQLLTGHIHLYGLKQPEKAAGFYSQVVESSQEPTYRDLARQGLEHCSAEQAKPVPEVVKAKQPALLDPPFLTKATPTTGDKPAGAAPAMPWLQSGESTTPAAQPAAELLIEPPVAAEEDVELIELPEEEPPGALPDPTIVEANFVEAKEPEPQPAPAPTSAFSNEEQAQLAKGRLRVILR